MSAKSEADWISNDLFFWGRAAAVALEAAARQPERTIDMRK